MRKIEVAVPKGKGKWVAFRAEKAGAVDVIILESHGPGVNRELVTIAANEKDVDAIIKSISEYEDKKHIKPDIRIWKAEEPFAQVEKEGKEARKVPFEELKAHAYESASVDITYLLLCILSGLLAALGLLMDSAIVVIGAMIIAPLLRPITTSSLGTVTGDVLMFWRGVSALIIGLLISGIVVFFAMFLLPMTAPSELLTTISQLSLLTLGVAFISGIIAAVSLLTDLNEALAGVAISVSLMPPAAALSINVFFSMFGIVEFNTVMTTLLILMVNVISIDIGSAVVFYAYGVTPKKHEKKFFSTHMKVAVLMLFMLSIPFVYTSFVSYEQTKARVIITEGVNTEVTLIGGTVERMDILFDPFVMDVELKVIATQPPPDGFRQKLESRLGSELGQKVRVKLTYVQAEAV